MQNDTAGSGRDPFIHDILGLLIMNTLMCASAAGLFTSILARPNALRALTLVTSAYSIVVGTIFLLGSADKLPSLTG